MPDYNETRFIQVSDIHLGSSDGDKRRNAGDAAWDTFMQHIEEDPPQLIIVAGDLVVSDPDNENDQKYAKNKISAIPVPTIILPGNHDVGDHAIRCGLPHEWHGKLVNDYRVSAWEELWGKSYWFKSFQNISLIGLNSQVIGSGTYAEDEQWQWLNEVALPFVNGKPIIVFSHEAFCHQPGVTMRDEWMSIPTQAAERYLSVFSKQNVLALCAGHTHRYLQWQSEGFRCITSPSLVSSIPCRNDMTQPQGNPEAGWIEYTLSNDGFSVRLKTINS